MGVVVGGGVCSATQDYFVIQEAEQLCFRAKRKKKLLQSLLQTGDLILEEKCSINTSTELSDTPGNKSLDSYVNIRGEIRSIECPIDQS